jgi:hypothetical protein
MSDPRITRQRRFGIGAGCGASSEWTPQFVAPTPGGIPPTNRPPHFVGNYPTWLGSIVPDTLFEAPSNYTGCVLEYVTPSGYISGSGFSAFLDSGTYTFTYARKAMPKAFAQAVAANTWGLLAFDGNAMSGVFADLGEFECYMAVNPYPRFDYKRPNIQVAFAAGTGGSRVVVGGSTVGGVDYDSFLDAPGADGASDPFIRVGGMLMGFPRHFTTPHPTKVRIPGELGAYALGVVFNDPAAPGLTADDIYDLHPANCRPYDALTVTAGITAQAGQDWASAEATATMRFLTS